jgi:glycosyltransferase involved in cell wall biosynthesis
MRTALLANELATRGHEVTWWASSFDHASRKFAGPGGGPCEILDSVEARLLPALGYGSNLSVMRYLDHRYVARCFRRELTDVEPPDLVVAATPDYHIAADAATFARRNGVPYVIDVRDPWPDAFVDLAPTPIGKLGARMILAPDFRKVKRMIRGADGLVAMMESMLDWGLGHAGRARGARDAVFYLGTDDPAAPDLVLAHELRKSLQGRPAVVYVGTFGSYNHPGVVLEAARLLESRGEWGDFDLVIGGEGDLFKPLSRQYSDLPGVHFTGWLDAAQISAVLSVGSVGVVPWTRGHAFPNKAFSYLAAGLPILTSADGDLRHLVEGEGIGRFFEPGSAEGLAGMFKDLLGDRKALDGMRRRVSRVYSTRFRADVIYEAYADYLEMVVTG